MGSGTYLRRLLVFGVACLAAYVFGTPYVMFHDEKPGWCVYHGLQGTRVEPLRYEFCSTWRLYPLRYPLVGSSDDTEIPNGFGSPHSWVNHPSWDSRRSP